MMSNDARTCSSRLFVAFAPPNLRIRAGLRNVAVLAQKYPHLLLWLPRYPEPFAKAPDIHNTQQHQGVPWFSPTVAWVENYGSFVLVYWYQGSICWYIWTILNCMFCSFHIFSSAANLYNFSKQSCSDIFKSKKHIQQHQQARTPTYRSASVASLSVTPTTQHSLCFGAQQDPPVLGTRLLRQQTCWKLHLIQVGSWILIMAWYKPI